MNFLDALLENYILVTAVIGWFSAQVLKTVIDAHFNKRVQWGRLVGSGGMPSSHSSFVVSMTTASALQYGLESPYFALGFALSAVVMYDAAGVRRETGKQSAILNKILLDNPFDWEEEEFEKKLKEYVGHTPLQVLAGALLGVIVAYVMGAVYAVI